VKGPATQSTRAWLIHALRDLLARLSQDERHKLAAELGITPIIHVNFVDSDGAGRPKEANRL
jgi:hypothetical protein